MRRGDRWLIGIILITGLILIVWRQNFADTGRVVLIQQDRRIIERFVLAPNVNLQKRIRLNKEWIVVEVKEGAVRLREHEESFCPQSICQRTGWIRRVGESIVCVPRHLTITMTSKSQTVDGVAR